ncbi:MAG: hypothetical protein LBH16_05100 [Treponema sp.]|jgi:hypothetical protein|nr:hypothetical protein [Treponema sp.]
MKKIRKAGILPPCEITGKPRLIFSMTAVLIIFLCFQPLYAADPQRPPINVNVIIDSSAAYAGVKENITSWITDHLDQIFVQGDMVTVWNAGSSVKVVYSGKISGDPDKESVKNTIREISASSGNADLSAALREAAGVKGQGYSYTLLVSVSQEALYNLLSGSNANLLRYSRTEEFSGWRAFVVGLDIDAKVKRAAAAFPAP